MNGSGNTARNPRVAALLGVIPGVGHVYLGQRVRGLTLLGVTITGGLALVAGPALVAPGNARLVVLCFLLYFLLVLPVAIVFSVLDAYHRAAESGRPAGDTETVASNLVAWGWCMMLTGFAGLVWVGLRSGMGDGLVVRLTPLVIGLLGIWLAGTGTAARRPLNSNASLRPQRAGRVTAIVTMAVGAVLLVLGLSGQTARTAMDLWGLIPLFTGLEIMIAGDRWHRGDKAWPIRVDDLAIFITVVALVAGAVASPLAHMTSFPFTSTLQLPRVFNLGQPRYKAADSDTGTSFSIPGEPVSLTYIYTGSGNLKIVGDPNARGVSPTVRSVARADSIDEADKALAAATVTYGSKGLGEYWIYDDSILPGWVRPEPGRAEVTRDTLLVVPAALAVNVDIRFGQVKVVGVRGGVKVKTGFGQVDVIDCGGAIDVTTGWGDVRITGSTQSVAASSDFGAVYCTASRVTGPLSLKTKIGRIRCSLPAGASIDLTAETKQGSIRTTFPARSTRAYGSQSRSATVGGGDNRVELQTGFGDISVTTPR